MSKDNRLFPFAFWFHPRQPRTDDEVHELLKNEDKEKKTISETVVENEDVNDHDESEMNLKKEKK